MTTIYWKAKYLEKNNNESHSYTFKILKIEKYIKKY